MQLNTPSREMEPEMNNMKMNALSAAAVLIAAFAGGPVTAQEVITNPGKCAQFYPNANCENYGPGNPYRGPQSYQGGWRNGYAWDRYPAHRYRRHHSWR
jgi:hypothetical protein